MNEKYENSPFAKNIRIGERFQLRDTKNDGVLRNDAEVLIGDKTLPLIARRKINKGWVYCVNISAYVTPKEVNLIKNVIK